jgi:hypothetical protein
LPRSRRSSLALVCLFVVASCGQCGRDKRKPIARGDGGPPVVRVEREHDAEGPASGETEPNDTPAQAQLILPGARVAAELSTATDVDCFRLGAPDGVDLGTVDVDAGAGSVVLASITAGPPDPALRLELVDARGRVRAARGASLRGSATLSQLRLEHDSFVCVRLPRSKDPAARGDHKAYVLSYATRVAHLEEQPQPEIELDDTQATAIVLDPSGTLAGVLDGNDDRDLIALPQAAAGTTFRVELSENADAEAGAQIELTQRAGTSVLATARGGGSELRLRNLPSTGAGFLYLQLRTLDSHGPMPYTLRVAGEPALPDGVEVEPNNDVAHANQAVPGDSIAGYLWPGDVDFFCADAALGARVDALADVDFKLELTDALGHSIAKADEGKRGAGETLPVDPRARCVRLSARQRDTAFDAPYHLSFLK